jgi:hypothetical protein
VTELMHQGRIELENAEIETMTVLVVMSNAFFNHDQYITPGMS